MQLERPVDGGNSGTPGNRPGRLTWDSGNRKTFTDLSAALLQHQPIILLIGAEGAGKTALLDDWAEECAGSICLARPDNLDGGPDAVMQEVANAFDVQAEAADKNALTAALRQKLTSLIDLGDIPVLIVDDAHKLESNKIELLRLLSSIRHGGVPLLRLIMSGTSKLEDLVRTNDVRGRDQVVVINLNPLSLDAGVRLFRNSIQSQTDGAVTCGIDEARTILGKIGTLPGDIVEAAGKIAKTAMAGRWSRVSDKRSLDIVSDEEKAAPEAAAPPREKPTGDTPAVERMIGDHGSLPTSIRESEDPRLLLRWAFGMNNAGGPGGAEAHRSPPGLAEPESPPPTPPGEAKPSVRPGSPAAALEALDSTEEDELKFPEPSPEITRELGRLAEREQKSSNPKVFDPSGFSDREPATGPATEIAASPEMQAELSRDLRLAIASESSKPSNMRFVYYGGAFAAGLALALFGWPVFRDQVLPPAPQTAQRPSGELITAISVGTVTDQSTNAAPATGDDSPGIPETGPTLTAMIEQIKTPQDDDRIVASRFSDLAGTGVRFPEPDVESRPLGLQADAPALTRATFSEQPSVPVGLSTGTSVAASTDGLVRAESEVAILKTERDTLASDISTLDSERQALSQEIGELEGRIADLTRQAAALSTAIADSETTMTDRVDRIETLSAQEATLAGRVETLQATEEDIQARLAAERDALDAAIADAAKFEAEAGLRRTEAEAAVAKLTGEIEDLNATRDALATSIAQAETSAAEAVSKLGDTQKAVLEESERLEALRSEIASSEDRLLALQSEAETTAVAAATAGTAGQTAEIDAEISELEDRLAALSAEESVQTAELDELNGVVAALKDEIAALTAARDDSLAALETTNADRNAAASQLAGLEAEIVATQDAISAASAQIAASSRDQDGAEAAAARTAELEAEVAALTAQLAALGETDQATGAATQEEVEALTAELARLRTEESVARADLSDAMRQLTENREAARAAAEEEQALASRLDALKANVAALQAEEENLAAELETARADLVALDTDVGTATTQSSNEIAALKADIQRLTEDRTAAETRLSAARSQLQSEVSEAEARRDAARAAADQETRRLTEVIASVEEIEAKRLTAMEELRQTEEQLVAERTERQTALSVEQDELAAEIETARAQLDKIRAETRAEQTVLSEARAERTTLEAQVASIKSEFATETERFQTEVSRLSEEETSLVASIEAKLTQLDGIVTDLNSNQRQTAGFAARSEEQTRDAEELSTKRAELLAEVETAEQTLAALRENIADEQARRVAALAGEAATPVPAGPAIAVQPPRRGEGEASAGTDAASDEPVGRSRELVERVLVDLPGIERLDDDAVDRLTEELVAGACLTDALSTAAGRINRHMLAGLCANSTCVTR